MKGLNQTFGGSFFYKEHKYVARLFKALREALNLNGRILLKRFIGEF